MDVSQYKAEFISEARDHLESLNSDLVVLEKDPNNDEVIQRLFRSFHTLKGNAAAMGYVKFSELSHSLEDMLAKIRDKEIKVTSELMSIIFEGCDSLEDGLEKISADASEDIDIESILAEVKQALGIKEQVFNISISPKLELSDVDKGMISNAANNGLINPYRVILVFDNANILKIAKSLLVLKILTKDNSSDIALVKITPDVGSIKEGKFSSEVEFVIVTRHSADVIRQIIDKISGIKEVHVLSIDSEYVKSAHQEATDKEFKKQEIIQKHQDEVVKNIQSVKVGMEELDKLMNLVGELLISNMRLKDIGKKNDAAMLRVVLAETERLIIDLKDEVMKVRMVPIGNVFNRFPRMVRDLATKESKKINFIMEGQEIEFDRTILDQIGDPLVHMLRNSVDHGIESPQDRLHAGKPEEGTIKIIAYREKNNAVIEVVDDGAGVDPDKVRDACIKKGVISSQDAQKMTPKELQMLIFRARVSTNSVVTEVSGRGVGMDVVSTSVKHLGGSVMMNSEVGKGTSIKLELPLTVAIITAFLVKVGNEIYAIPLNAIDETVAIKGSDLRTIKGYDAFVLRGKELPLFWLHDVLRTGSRGSSDELLVVVVNHAKGLVGLVVDDIVSQQQILIKSLQDMVKGTKGCAGATILGDGSIALILDVNSLIG